MHLIANLNWSIHRCGEGRGKRDGGVGGGGGGRERSVTALMFDFPVGVDLCGGNWGRNTWRGQVNSPSQREVLEIPVSLVI